MISVSLGQAVPIAEKLLQGHHQAKLVIARVEPSVNDSIIGCWINESDVLLEYHLTIGE